MAWSHLRLAQAHGRSRRWRGVSAWQRRAWGVRMRGLKGTLHAHRVQALNGHMAHMRLCRHYMRKLGRSLTPEDRVWIRSRHAAEILASAKLLDESNRTSVRKHGANDRH